MTTPQLPIDVRDRLRKLINSKMFVKSTAPAEELFDYLFDFVGQELDLAVKEERERAIIIARSYSLNKMVGDKPNLVIPEKIYRDLLELNKQFDEVTPPQKE